MPYLVVLLLKAMAGCPEMIYHSIKWTAVMAPMIQKRRQYMKRKSMAVAVLAATLLSQSAGGTDPSYTDPLRILKSLIFHL